MVKVHHLNEGSMRCQGFSCLARQRARKWRTGWIPNSLQQSASEHQIHPNLHSRIGAGANDVDQTRPNSHPYAAVRTNHTGAQTAKFVLSQKGDEGPLEILEPGRVNLGGGNFLLPTFGAYLITVEPCCLQFVEVFIY